MEKEIPINTNIKKFFRQYVEVLQPLFDIRSREADVFAALLYESYLRRDIGDLKDRFKLILDYDTKIKIQEELNMTTAVFRNCLTRLRKKGLVGKYDIIKPGYLINPDEKETVNIKFIFKFTPTNG
jgi:predicted transcriptional regulator